MLLDPSLRHSFRYEKTVNCRRFLKSYTVETVVTFHFHRIFEITA